MKESLNRDIISIQFMKDIFDIEIERIYSQYEEEREKNIG
jgi:hypothetical protein